MGARAMRRMMAAWALVLSGAAAIPAAAAPPEAIDTDSIEPGSSAGDLPAGSLDAAPASVQADGTITFDEFSVNTTITDQYQPQGVVFSPLLRSFIATDGAQPTSPALSGTPRYDGPIHFSIVDPATGATATTDGFSLDVGYINNRNSVEIRYRDRFNNPIGSVRANALGINRIEVPARGVAHVTIEATEFERSGFTIDNLRLNTIVSQGGSVDRMVSLGDSFTSGEGLLGHDDVRYDCGTDLHPGRYRENSTVARRAGQAGPYDDIGRYDCDTVTLSTPDDWSEVRERPIVEYENRCHRHRGAWAVQAASQMGVTDHLFVACSGAVTANLGFVASGVAAPRAQYPLSPLNVAGGYVQRTDARVFHQGGPVDLVTVGIGGNDAGFTDLIEHCISVRACNSDVGFTTSTYSRIDNIVYPRLVETFRGVREDFPEATILTYGYPNVVSPDTRTCPGVGQERVFGKVLDEGERRWAEERLLPTLNQAISDAAAAAGVTYMPIDDVTVGHEACTDDPWVNGLRWGDDIGLWGINVVGNESFHPNEKGHDAIFDHFITHYTDGNGSLTFANTDPNPTIRPPVERITVNVGSVDAVPCGVECLQQTCGDDSCSLLLRLRNYDPDTTLTVEGYQTPGQGGLFASLDDALGYQALGDQPIASVEVTTNERGEADAYLAIAENGGGDIEIRVGGESAGGVEQRGVAYLTFTDAETDPEVEIEDPGEPGERELVEPTGLPAPDQILRLYRAAFGRSPDATGFQFWVDAYINDARPLLLIATEFTASDEWATLYGTDPTAEELVEALYQNVLERPGEAGGVTFWVGELESGRRDLAQVLVEFTDSDENIALTATSAPLTQEQARIHRLYRAVMGRSPDAGGLDFWVARSRQGETLTRIAEQFLGSPEWHDRYGSDVTDAELVTLLYRNILDREPDASGRDHWLAELAGGVPPARVLVSFSESVENRMRTGTAP